MVAQVSDCTSHASWNGSLGTLSPPSSLAHLVRCDRVSAEAYLTSLDLAGGFWTAYGIIVQPSMGLAASFAPPGTDPLLAASVGAATRAYNAGLGMYFAVWGILCIVYFIASLRT